MEAIISQTPPPSSSSIKIAQQIFTITASDNWIDSEDFLDYSEYKINIADLSATSVVLADLYFDGTEENIPSILTDWTNLQKKDAKQENGSITFYKLKDVTLSNNIKIKLAIIG